MKEFWHVNHLRPPLYFTVAEVPKLLGASRQWVRYMTERDHDPIPFFTFNVGPLERTVISEPDLAAWVRRNEHTVRSQDFTPFYQFQAELTRAREVDK